MNRFDKQEIADDLTLYKTSIKYPTLSAPSNIENILEKLQTQTSIKQLGPQELSEYIIIINSYSLYLTIEENRLKAEYNWCESNIKHLVGREMENVEAYGFNEKDHIIRSKNETASKLAERQLLCKAKIDLLCNLSYKLQFITEGLKNLTIEKYRSVK